MLDNVVILLPVILHQFCFSATFFIDTATVVSEQGHCSDLLSRVETGYLGGEYAAVTML